MRRSQWVVIKSFDTAEECEEWKVRAQEEANEIAPTFDVDRCLASDDPRLLK
jgi:hypothetical protein